MSEPVRTPGLLRLVAVGALGGSLFFFAEAWILIVHLYFRTAEQAPTGYLAALATYSGFGVAVWVGASVVAAIVRRIRPVLLLAMVAAVLVAAATFLAVAAPAGLGVAETLGHAALFVASAGGVLIVACGVEGSFRLRARPVFGLLAGLVAFLVAGQHASLRAFGWERVFHPGEARVPDDSRPNVLLLTIDTLRADRLGAYGYTRHETPAIDRIAREGTLFERAISASPWTRPSFASLLTSLYPSQHGAFVVRDPSREGDLYSGRLNPEVSTLAERYRQGGYFTAALQTNWQASDAHGFDRGFDVFLHSALFRTPFREHLILPRYLGEISRRLGFGRKALPFWAVAPPGEDVLPIFHRLIDAPVREPFFLWVNLMDPHSPYSDWGEGAPHPGASPRHEYDNEDPAVPLEALDRAYDSEVRYTDRIVGEILASLDRRDLASSTILVFTSDHGEEFGDHGVELEIGGRTVHGRHHGHSLYNELLRVPLILRHPGKVPAGHRVSATVRLIDVMPTLLELSGLDGRDEAYEGSSLVELLSERPREDGSRIAFSERLYYGEEKKSVQNGDWKMIFSPGAGGSEIYDVRSDPGETRPLELDGHPEHEALRGSLEKWMARMDAVELLPGGGPEVRLSPIEKERLRALGYVE